MPANVSVHLHWPTHDKEIIVKKKIALDGSYRDEKAQFHAALMPGMSTPAALITLRKETLNALQADLKNADPSSSQIIHIDAETGVQIKYTRLLDERGNGWMGIPGRYTFKAQINKDAQDLQDARHKEQTKLFVIMMILVLAAFAGILIMAGIAFG